jgi:hypothetical protein
MLNPDTEILFPLRLIPSLVQQRKESWRNLVEKLSTVEVNPVDQAAFVLMMVRLAGCVACNADSFRAMRGCTVCSRQTIRRFRGSDEDLINLFQQAKREIVNFMQKQQKKD